MKTRKVFSNEDLSTTTTILVPQCKQWKQHFSCVERLFVLFSLLTTKLLNERGILSNKQARRDVFKSGGGGPKNPSIYKLIRWFAGPMGQTTRQPSVWCSKYYFFYKITNMKIKSFECPKFIRNCEKNTWNVRCLVDELFVPSTQQTSVLYSRLLDFKSLPS